MYVACSLTINTKFKIGYDYQSVIKITFSFNYAC